MIKIKEKKENTDVKPSEKNKISVYTHGLTSTEYEEKNKKIMALCDILNT